MENNDQNNEKSQNQEQRTPRDRKPNPHRQNTGGQNVNAQGENAQGANRPNPNRKPNPSRKPNPNRTQSAEGQTTEGQSNRPNPNRKPHPNRKPNPNRNQNAEGKTTEGQDNRPNPSKKPNPSNKPNPNQSRGGGGSKGRSKRKNVTTVNDVMRASLEENARVKDATMNPWKKIDMASKGKIRFTPLGGLGEIGGNMAVLETETTAIIIDVGMSFPDETMHGVDILVPDFSYLHTLKETKDVYVIITHGHEDHIGAMPYFHYENFNDFYKNLPKGTISWC